jgi:hypothetical protein
MTKTTFIKSEYKTPSALWYSIMGMPTTPSKSPVVVTKKIFWIGTWADVQFHRVDCESHPDTLQEQRYEICTTVIMNQLVIVPTRMSHKHVVSRIKVPRVVPTRKKIMNGRKRGKTVRFVSVSEQEEERNNQNRSPSVLSLRFVVRTSFVETIRCLRKRLEAQYPNNQHQVEPTQRES